MSGDQNVIFRGLILILRVGKLHLIQLPVHALVFHQLTMGTAFYYHTILNNDDLVCMFDGAEPVGYYDGRPILHEAGKGLLYELFTFGIQG